MVFTCERPLNADGLLYPMMVIAAAAIVAFSLAGTATLTGWMPSVLESGTGSTHVEQPFGCAECGLIESVREIERRSTGGDGAAEPVNDTAQR
jgi:hypothetical protein